MEALLNRIPSGRNDTLVCIVTFIYQVPKSGIQINIRLSAPITMDMLYHTAPNGNSILLPLVNVNITNIITAY